ncbi:MAG: nickel/cobalt transporter [Pyrinomonadaceae bacterium]
MGIKIALILVLSFVFAVSITAHPLGNFSLNNYSRIEMEKNQIRLRCVSDIAEIPTFQESQQIDANKNGTLETEELDSYLEKITTQFISNLKLSVDGQPLQIQSAAKNISLVPGAGNLSTLRFEWDFTTEISDGSKDAIRRVRFENNNHKERVGWNEIVVNRVAGTNVFDSTTFGSGITDELRTYPEDMLLAPLSEREAEFSFTTSAVAADVKLLQNRNGGVSAPVQKDKFAELISVREFSPAIIAFSLLLAFGFGAMHAMSPGHGKTVVGAYLIGSRGTFKHAVFLGLTVTITHTLGVFALGLITIFASNFILPEKMMPFLSFVSGLLVFFIGISLFKDRLFSFLGWKTVSHHHDGHEHSHSHERHHEHAHPHENHDHTHHDQEHHHSHDGLTHSHGGSTHTHLPPENITWKSLLGLGISGGLLPCPSALVLMLAAINLGRVGYGLVLTLVFSLGLAATLTAVGLLFLYGGKVFNGTRLSAHPLARAVPVFSAFVITCLGAVICYNSLG